jgi:hypothetical protein
MARRSGRTRRSSSSSPAWSSSVRYGETSPPSSRSTVMASGSSGAEAMEYSRSAVEPSSAVSRTSTCCPARWPGQSGRSSPMVQTGDVSRVTEVTAAVCLVSRPCSAVPATGLRTCGSSRSPRSPARQRRAGPGRAPLGVELGPARHAVHVHRDGLGRQHREPIGHVLARRDPALLPVRGAAEMAEATRHRAHTGQLLSISVPFRGTGSPSPRLRRPAPSKVLVPLRRPAPRGSPA